MQFATHSTLSTRILTLHCLAPRSLPAQIPPLVLVQAPGFSVSLRGDRRKAETPIINRTRPTIFWFLVYHWVQKMDPCSIGFWLGAGIFHAASSRFRFGYFTSVCSYIHGSIPLHRTAHNSLDRFPGNLLEPLLNLKVKWFKKTRLQWAQLVVFHDFPCPKIS